MSLPTSKKQTSEKPVAGAVIEPLNKANKEADIDRQVRYRASFREYSLIYSSYAYMASSKLSEMENSPTTPKSIPLSNTF